MPVTTANDLFGGSGDELADEVADAFNASLSVRGAGMQCRFDAETLRRFALALPNDTLDITYSIAAESTKYEARLTIKLDDPNNLFAGAKLIDVLGNLLAQFVEQRLADDGKPAPGGWIASAEL